MNKVTLLKFEGKSSPAGSEQVKVEKSQWQFFHTENTKSCTQLLGERDLRNAYLGGVEETMCELPSSEDS